MINGPGVQPCELTKSEGKKSIWNLYEWKPLASFLFKPSPNPLVKTVFMAKGALSQHLSTSPLRLLKMFFLKRCHMSSETNGGFYRQLNPPSIWLWTAVRFAWTTSPIVTVKNFRRFLVSKFLKKKKFEKLLKKLSQVLFCDCSSFLIVGVLRFKILRRASKCNDMRFGMFALGETAC